MKKSNQRYLSLSIITPFFNEQDMVDIYFKRVTPVLNKITSDWEIVCINDGSTDNTPLLLYKYVQQEPRIKLINLSRNFGKEAALSAGLDYSTKNAIIPLDCDLQDPPDLIPEMINKWQEGFDMVLAVRKSRNESVIKKLFAAIYHKIINVLTNGNIPQNVGDFRLLDRKTVDTIKTLEERNRFMKGVFAWVGYNKTIIYYHRPARASGTPKLGFFKLLQLGFDGIISFSSKPLKVWLYLGLVFSGLSFAYACYLILRTLFFGVDLPGYASIMVSVLFMGGIQLVSLGVIGEYIARIFKEVKRRPIYIVDEKYGFNQNDNQAEIISNKEKQQAR